MFMVAGTSANIWMTNPPARGIPDFGSRFYVDDLDQDYANNLNDFYQDGEPD